MFHHPAINQKPLIVTVIEVSLDQMGESNTLNPIGHCKGRVGGMLLSFQPQKTKTKKLSFPFLLYKLFKTDLAKVFDC